MEISRRVVSRVVTGSLLVLLGMYVLITTYRMGIHSSKVVLLGPSKPQIVYVNSPAIDNIGGSKRIGPTTVTSRWEYTLESIKGSPSGEYQFKDDNGIVTLYKFCNTPPPDFKRGTKLTFDIAPKDDNITIEQSIKKDSCVVFLQAQVIQEPK